MRLLIDEDTAVQLIEPLRHVLFGHDVMHISGLSWKGKKDLRVLPDAKNAGFDALITKDRAQLNDPRECAAINIRTLFKLGRTAAYELTHRPDFPDPVPISPRSYRWWASEVEAFADALRHKRADKSAGGGGTRRMVKPRTPDPATPPRRITGKVRAARARREAP